MSVDHKWLTREKWTLIEAALICAGIEPYAGGDPTDNPHDVLKRIDDRNRRELFHELYARSKDSVSSDSLQPGEATRTGYIGSIRVRPSAYVIWAIDSPLPKGLASLIDMEVLKPVFGPPLPSRPDDSLLETELGYTIDGAATELVKRYGVNEDATREREQAAMRERIRAAVMAGELKLTCPTTRMPYQGLRFARHLSLLCGRGWIPPGVILTVVAHFAPYWYIHAV